MRSQTRLAAAVALLTLALASGNALADGTPPAKAPSPEQQEAARARFRRGVQLFDDGDYKLALVEFTRAYEAAPNYRVLYNIGEVHAQLGNYARAMRALKEYLKQGGNEIPADRRRDLEREIASMRPRTATLTVRVSVPDAAIELDQEVLGRSPSPPQSVDGGEHRIRVTKPGYLPHEESITLAGGDVNDVYVTLVPLSTAPTRQVEHPVRPEVWISWSATGALAVAAGVCGGLALKYNSDLATLRNTAGSSDAQRHDDANRAQTFAIATDVLGGAAIAAAAVSVYFTLRKPASSTVRMGIGPGSVNVAGSF